MLSDFLVVLGLAALPAAGNFFGGVLAEMFRVSERALSLSLHLAAGIVLAVVGLELMPEALKASQPWVPLLAFVVGVVNASVAGAAVTAVAVWIGRSATCRPGWGATSSRRAR